MNLIPIPKKISITDGEICAGKIVADFKNLASNQTDKAFEMLCNDLDEKNKSEIKLCVNQNNIFTDEEEYILKIDENGIYIESGHSKGVFYAIQTLRQILNSEKAFKFCEIHDKPDFKFRGLQNDTTRGRVPTVSGLKKIADICAYLKINVIALYFEHSFAFREFEGIVAPDECLTPDELREFVKYCELLYIDVIPYVAMFGHQYRLLQSDKYKHLCELENYTPSLHYWQERMLHHSIDISNPESLSLIKSFIDQLTEVFPCEIYIPGIDETFDLCKGRNKDKNMIEQYCTFTDEICAYLKEKGKTALIADDIIQKHDGGFLLKSENIIMYHWDYDNEPNEEQYKILSEKNLPFVAVPTTWAYNSVIEESVRSSKNIFNSIVFGKKYGAEGVLNTIWGDRGHWCDFNCTLYGVAMGAAKAWNTETFFDEEFEKSFSDIIFGEKNENIVKLTEELKVLTNNACLYWMVRWYSENIIKGENTPLTLIDPEIKPIINAKKAYEILKRAEKLATEHEEKTELYESFIAACGMCEAQNILCDAITDKRKLTSEERTKIEDRMTEYKRVWLRDNKESEFYENRNFMDGIMCYLEKIH